MSLAARIQERPSLDLAAFPADRMHESEALLRTQPRFGSLPGRPRTVHRLPQDPRRTPESSRSLQAKPHWVQRCAPAFSRLRHKPCDADCRLMRRRRQPWGLPRSRFAEGAASLERARVLKQFHLRTTWQAARPKSVPSTYNRRTTNVWSDIVVCSRNALLG